MRVHKKVSLYRISADGGSSWSEQWLSDYELDEMVGTYHFICVPMFVTERLGAICETENVCRVANVALHTS